MELRFGRVTTTLADYDVLRALSVKTNTPLNSNLNILILLHESCTNKMPVLVLKCINNGATIGHFRVKEK